MDDVPEIAETFAFPAKSPERKRLLNILRNRGNYEHNQEVMRNNSGELKLMRRPDAKLRIRASSTQQEHESSLSSDEHDSDGNCESDAQDQDPTFTSKNYCYVCGKGVHKIARHFLTHIDDEPEIAEACSLPVRSPERSRLLDRLRNRGNYEHNQEVMRNNTGELKLKKRPNAAMASVEKYGHCPHCKGMFNRVDLWRHVPRCGQKMSATCGKTGVLNEVSLGSRCPQKSSGVWQMLLSMRQDNVALVVQNDGLLMQLAQSLYEKHGNNPTKQEYSRQKLREMGRLLLTLHEKLIFSSEDAMKLKNFSSVVDAVKKIACFDRENKSYRKPNLALRLGYSLKALGNIVISGADSSAKMVSDAKKFMVLCDEEWTELSGQKAKGPATIPFTRDVQAFYRYLEKESTSATESMKTSENPQVYKILCRATLAQACVLNRCPLEVSRMTLKSFQERDDTTRVLSKHFIRINIAKKTGQSVAVLLTSQLVAALTLLVSKRLICGVHEDNPFLFAKPNMSSTSLCNGGNCVRDFSSLCCAQNPEYLRSMNLHKHMARIFQILNLENDELDHLAKLLGHGIRTDRDYYRLPEAAVELAKIAKLLVAMEKGSLEGFKGNSLDEIEIEDELELDLEKGNAENIDAEDNTEESDRTQRSGDVRQQGRRLTPQQDALEHIKARRDKHFLEEKFIDSLKGKGVFTRQSIEPSTFVVEYRGNILTHKEMQKCGDTSDEIMFDFRWKGTNWCIDASAEDGSLGRLVNEDHTNPNCEMKKIVYKGRPHLCLFALKKISPDEEITFIYKESRVKDSAEASSCAESDSDEDYVCDDQPNSNDGFISDNNQNEQDFKASSNQQEDKSDHSSDFESDSDEESTKGCTFTKKNYCYVCGRAQSKISRHLLTHRGEEPDIAQVLKLRRNSKERKILLEKLRNRGNYKHNQEVLRTRSGELKVRRTSEMIKTFATCIYCKAMYGRKELWRHMQKCPSKRFSNPPAGGRTQILTLIAATGLTDPDQLSPGVRNMLKKLKKDEIGSVVWEDPYILQLAQCLYYINEEKQRDSYINQSLRQMARLLMTLRKKSIGSFEEAIKPSNFSSVVEAVRELAGFNQETKVCDKRTVIWKMGYLVKKIADIKYGRTLKDEKADQGDHTGGRDVREAVCERVAHQHAGATQNSQTPDHIVHARRAAFTPVRGENRGFCSPESDLVSKCPSLQRASQTDACVRDDIEQKCERAL
ncbi:uncharacterized protein LOC125019481 [Mugil cephalus]|uniref:uncharacterized protein LOC125019481 n=1 Tax=Mugil cephalus TaxID=48193 RepID=UPI001FB684F2|nr:uncharacterized protein LOC125019481 [Mugil cephalus]